MDRIAYIIISHKDPNHLRRLILELNYNADFFIHVDKRNYNNDFKRALDGINGNIYLRSKYNVNWGGFSLVLVQKEMIKTILETKNHYKRIVFMSGLDYPVLSNKEIHGYFDGNPDMEIIAGQNISTDEPEEIHRITKYYIVDNPFLIKNIFFLHFLKKMIFRFRLNPKKREFSYLGKTKINIYFGGSWFALTYPCLKHVHKTLCKEKKFLRYISTAFAPDELCIQTIVFNSKYKDKSIRMPKNFAIGLSGDEAFEKISPLHFLKYREKMETLTEFDYENILKSKKMFIRKVETGESDKLLKMIDQLRKK